jgi:hypothetical protein
VKAMEIEARIKFHDQNEKVFREFLRFSSSSLLTLDSSVEVAGSLVIASETFNKETSQTPLVL